MPRQILGTNKFEVYFFNGMNVRKKQISYPKDFVYKQWGIILVKDKNDKTIEKLQFNDIGKMLSIINKIMRKSIKGSLKLKGTWK